MTHCGGADSSTDVENTDSRSASRVCYPRRRTPRAALRFGSMAPRLRSAVVRFDALPEPALRVLFLTLPVDARARAACVCRGWRAFLSDVSLWQVLDLSPAGVAAERVTENLVRGALARAAGRLRILRLESEVSRLFSMFLVDLIVLNGIELRQVNGGLFLNAGDVESIVAATPRLQVLNADVIGPCMTLLPMLRNEPPYGPLRVRKLRVGCGNADAAGVHAFAAAVASHESLKDLRVGDVPFLRGTNALVDAAAERRVSSLTLTTSVLLDAGAVPALARLLQRGSLAKLDISCAGFPRDESMPALCAALRGCRTLKHLSLELHPPGGATRRAVTELFDTVASLPALTELDLSNSWVRDKAAFGRDLGALLLIDQPSLRTLDLFNCQLGDEGLAPLLDGLAANTHLRELNCGMNDPSGDFKRDELDPALAELAARAELAA